MSNTASSKPIRLGIVGLSTGGWAASAHVPALAHPSLSSTFTLTALQTSSETSAAAAKEALSKSWPSIDASEVMTYHGRDATDITNDPNVDVILVSVKAPDHKAILDKAVAAGKHVFSEYPPGKTLAESEQIRADVMRNGNIQFQVGLQATHSVLLRKVKKIIDYGKIGKIRSSTFIGNLPREPRYYQPEANDANLYSLDKTNGATLLTIPTAHKLSAFIYLLGPFATVSATGSRQYPTIDIYSAQDPTKFLRTIKSNALDHFTFTGSLKSGAHASITWKSGYKSTPGRKNLLWIIDGEEGSVTFEADDGNIMGTLDQKVSVNGKPVDEYMKDEGIEWVDDPALVVEEHEKGTFFESIRREWVEFGKSLRGGHGEFVSLDDAIEVQRVVDAVERSVELGGLGINLI